MRTAPTTVEAGRAGLLGSGLPFAILGVGLGIGLILGSQSLYQLQGDLAMAASVLPVGYAFGAGMVATVNPCGILLLPSLVAYYVGRETAAGPPGWGRRLSRAVLFGLLATAGFVVLFALVGLALALGGRALVAVFPFGGVLVGLALVGLGLTLALTGQGAGLAVAGRALGWLTFRDEPWALFLFGVGYGLASLACTLPVFLVVVGTALVAGSVWAALGRFVSYALGMGLVLTGVTVGAAVAEGAVRRGLRRLVPLVPRLAAAFLLGAGLFLTHYWLRALGWI